MLLGWGLNLDLMIWVVLSDGDNDDGGGWFESVLLLMGDLDMVFLMFLNGWR